MPKAAADQLNSPPATGLALTKTAKEEKRRARHSPYTFHRDKINDIGCIKAYGRVYDRYCSCVTHTRISSSSSLRVKKSELRAATAFPVFETIEKGVVYGRIKIHLSRVRESSRTRREFYGASRIDDMRFRLGALPEIISRVYICAIWKKLCV